MPDKRAEKSDIRKNTVNARKNPDSDPPSPLSIYLSSSNTIKQISEITGVEYNTLLQASKRDQWVKKKRALSRNIESAVIKRSTDVLCKQLETLQKTERQHFTANIARLEQYMASLDPDRKDYIYQCKMYADARKTLQAMQYRSYGITEQAGSNHQGGNVIFNNYPQSDVISRYRNLAIDVTLPPEANCGSPYTPKHASSDVDIIEKEAVLPDSEVNTLDSDSNLADEEYSAMDDGEIERVCSPMVESVPEGAKVDWVKEKIFGKKYEKMVDF